MNQRNVRDFIENTDLEIERKTEAVKVFNLNIAKFLHREGRIYRPETQTYIEKGRLSEKE